MILFTGKLETSNDDSDSSVTKSVITD